MKKLSSLLIAISAILFASNINAQTAASMNPKTLAASVIAANDADRLAMENLRLSNVKMYRDFTRNYKNASAISLEQKEDHTLITCTVDGKKNRILYNKKGIWQNTVRTYDNEKLSADMRNQVENGFPRYSIYGPVVEVITRVGAAHLILIENKTSWKRVRIVDGEMDTYEEWNKQ
jgi:hypothetical protein